MANSNELRIVVTGDSGQFSKTIAQVEAGIKRAEGATQSFGSHGVSNVQAVSASIRLLQGDFTRSIRSVELFISKFPALASAAKMAFPVIGGVMFGAMLIRLGDQVVEFIQKTRQVPQELQKAFNGTNLSGQTAVDELAKANDALRDQIAKLSGQRQNGLALMLDDARLAADKLEESLARDNDQLREQMKLHSVSMIGGLLTGQDRTAPVAGSVNYWDQEVEDRGHAYNQALHVNGNNQDSPAVQAAYKALTDRISDAVNSITRDRDMRSGNVVTSRGRSVPYSQIYGDQTANLEIDNAALTQLHGRQDLMNEQSDNDKLAAQEKSLQAAKDYAAKQKELQNQQVQAWHQQYDAENAVQLKSIQQTIDFWQKKADSVKQGSVAYNAAEVEANKGRADLLKQNTKDWQDSVMEQVQAGQMNQDSGKRVTSALTERWAKDYDSDQKEDAAQPELQRKEFQDWFSQMQDQVAEMEQSIRDQESDGTLTRADAARQMSSVHSQAYSAWQQKVQGVPIDAKEYWSQDRSFQNQQGADQRTMASYDIGPALRQAVNQFVNAATDIASQMKDILVGSIDKINDALSSSFFEKAHTQREFTRNVRNGLGGAFRSIGSDTMNAGLKSAEGGVLKAFGFGGKKPTGAAGDPLHVVMDSGASAAAGGASSSLLSFLHASGSSGLSTNGGSTGSGLTTTIASAALQGFFASGGDVVANKPAVVGDGGRPELFVPSTAGRIYPNTAALGGSSNHYYVDASGSTNPAATEATVHRVMRQYVPSIQAGSMRMVREYKARRPNNAPA